MKRKQGTVFGYPFYGWNFKIRKLTKTTNFFFRIWNISTFGMDHAAVHRLLRLQTTQWINATNQTTQIESPIVELGTPGISVLSDFHKHSDETQKLFRMSTVIDVRFSSSFFEYVFELFPKTLLCRHSVFQILYFESNLNICSMFNVKCSVFDSLIYFTWLLTPTRQHNMLKFIRFQFSHREMR